VRLTGRVLLPDGSPARGAVVVSSAGRSAAVGADGSFAFELAVDPAEAAVELTAVANGSQGSLVAQRTIDGLHGGSSRNAGTLHLAASGGCVPEWIPTFGGTLGPNERVLALAVYDDGSGPALYAGGVFTSAGGVAADAIARWDGQAWSGVGGGVSTGGIFGSPDVYALAVYDDGSGPALYAGGFFSSAGGVATGGIARWDGKSWTGLDGGVGSFSDGVNALAVFDDGGGPALFVGGGFATAGGIPASGIAKWDGAGWSALGSGFAGLDPSCNALTVFDDGAGPALYAAGGFTSAGGQSASGIAKWDGQGWSPLGLGIVSGFSLTPKVNALSVFDDGSGAGPALYAGGQFETAGGIGAYDIARWDGQGWSGLGTALGGGGVKSMVVFDDGSGSGPALWVGGSFAPVAGPGAKLLAKWDGQVWSVIPGLPFAASGEAIWALAAYDDGTGAGLTLFAGGEFPGVPGADYLAAWDGQDWSGLGSPDAGLNGEVHALAVYDDGSGGGPALYAGGVFTAAGSQTVNHIARWDGQAWSPLGVGVGGFGFPSVEALAVYDDGSGGGPALYAGGTFTTAGDHNANRIARWDGQVWTALAGGITGDGTNAAVNALAVYDDGSGAGPALYVGGNFNKAGPLTIYSIAKWQGLAWSPIGAGISDPGSASVYTLTVYDDGSGAGPALYVGGSFNILGLHNIARWNGQTWKPLGQGVGPQVTASCVYDDGSGSGPALFVAGSLSGAGDQTVKNIARWNGQSWSDVGGGMSGFPGSYDAVASLTVHDDGSGKGPALYVGGWFTIAGSQSANRIARWDGEEWSALGSGFDDAVRALIEFDDGSGAGPALIAGGMFADTPMGDSYLARWGCPAIDTLPGCFGNPAALTSLSQERSIGSTLEVSLSSSDFPTGLGVLYFGLEGVDASGCGLFVPSIGELLLALAPMPQPVGSGSLSAGEVTFALPVPANPSLVGVHVAFQGVTVGLFEPGTPIGMSNALAVTITQ
jgi:hypothetical protein